jgi:hypothetical protein
MAPPAKGGAVIQLGIMGEAIDRSKADLIGHSPARWLATGRPANRAR